MDLSFGSSIPSIVEYNTGNFTIYTYIHLFIYILDIYLYIGVSYLAN